MNGGQWKQVKPRVKYEHSPFFSTQTSNLLRHLSWHMNRFSKAWQQKMFSSQSHIWTSALIMSWGETCWQQIRFSGCQHRKVQCSKVRTVWGWRTRSQCQVLSRAVVVWPVCSLAFIYSSSMPHVSRPDLQNQTTSLRHCNITWEATVVNVTPHGKK